MKVTLFTSNNHRHNYLINLLFNICDELWVVQESKTLFPGAFKLSAYNVLKEMEEDHYHDHGQFLLHLHLFVPPKG